MLRLIHMFDLRAGVNEESFLSWLDSTFSQKASKFGCIERINWVFQDGQDDPYGKNKRIKKRPKYINEAFWKSQKDAEDFRQWLLSEDGRKYRKTWEDGVTNHSVLRYVDYTSPQSLGDD